MLSKVITIAQQKGGTGKTTLAVNLALAFIKYHNLKVAIIDTDPQGSLGKWFMIRSEKNISNQNLTFKTASLWGAQYESKILKQDHDIVIIDTPPKIESDARPAIEASNLVLIPIAPSPVDFWATESIIEIAKKAKRKILIQINRANHRSKLISKTHEYIKSINISAIKTLIGHRQIFIASMGEGKTVVEKQRKSKAVEEIRKISEQILLELK
jgi:chromosome partitioning protein